MIGSILSVLDFLWEKDSGVSSSHETDVSLTDSDSPPASPMLLFSAKKLTKRGLYEQLHGQLRNYYSEEEVDRLLVPLEKPSRFTPRQAWFNDNLVNDYFELLAKQYPVLEVISSLATQYEISLPDRLSTWQKYSEWKSKLSQSPLIFWPIHQADHWHLIIIENRSREANVYMLDGFNKENGTLLKKYGLDLVCSIRSELQYTRGEFMSVAQQKNTYDCGSVICFYAKLIAEFYHQNQQVPELTILNTSDVNYTSFRKEIANGLVNFKKSAKLVAKPKL